MIKSSPALKLVNSNFTRLASINAARSSRYFSSTCCCSFNALISYQRPLLVLRPIKVHRTTRQYTPLSIDKPAKEYNYDEIKKLSQQDHPDLVLVDVREPDEYNAGYIPTAINIPYKSSPGALGLDAEEFEEAFGFKKPSNEKELIFYCLGGVRSTAAENLAATFGYQK